VGTLTLAAQVLAVTVHNTCRFIMQAVVVQVLIQPLLVAGKVAVVRAVQVLLVHRLAQ
jgi:hypothetical protein